MVTFGSIILQYHFIFAVLCNSSKSINTCIFHFQILVRAQSHQSWQYMSRCHLHIYVWYLDYMTKCNVSEKLRKFWVKLILTPLGLKLVIEKLTSGFKRAAALAFRSGSELTTISHRILNIVP